MSSLTKVQRVQAHRQKERVRLQKQAEIEGLELPPDRDQPFSPLPAPTPAAAKKLARVSGGVAPLTDTEYGGPVPGFSGLEPEVIDHNVNIIRDMPFHLDDMDDVGFGEVDRANVPRRAEQMVSYEDDVANMSRLTTPRNGEEEREFAKIAEEMKKRAQAPEPKKEAAPRKRDTSVNFGKVLDDEEAERQTRANEVKAEPAKGGKVASDSVSAPKDAADTEGGKSKQNPDRPVARVAEPQTVGDRPPTGPSLEDVERRVVDKRPERKSK